MTDVLAFIADNLDQIEDWTGSVPAGAFQWTDGHDGTLDVGITYGCPCGCGATRFAHVQAYGSERHTIWEWDGNREKPTLKPSILIHELNEAGEKVGTHWHGHLTAGIFKGDKP